MSVVPLTLTISLCLVFTFVLFFLREHSRRRFSGAESESLLPFVDETPRVAGVATELAVAAAKGGCHSHDHHQGEGHACKGNGSCGSCSRRDQRRAATAAIVADYYVKKAAHEAAAASDTPRT